LVFGENKSYFLGILKVWDPLANHMTTTLRGLILNIKIDMALKWIMLNTLRDDFCPFTQKSKYFVTWTTSC
jgi:hypothetical protein